jgi:hypothetical protein
MNYKVLFFLFACVAVFSASVPMQLVDVNNKTADLNSFMQGRESVNILVIRTTDCISCVKTMLKDKLLGKGKKILVVGFLYEDELRHILLTENENILLLKDYKFTFIRKNKIKYTPAIITVNKNFNIVGIKYFGE